MKNLIRQIIEEENKRILNESGIRDIRALAKRYPMAKIYFHQDLDGVTTALAMKNYLEQNGIKVVDAEIIQYGSKEFAIKKVEGEGEIMPVLVDFAHGKPMFVIHTDHHDSQAGVEQGTSTNFKSSRSNVETISQSVSPKDIFSQDDIETISMIDSADYAKYDITPEQVVQYLFKIDRTKGVKENKKMMGLVANKLLLAFKNKPEFLRNLVMNSKPSLQNILLNIKDQMEKEGYAPIEQLMKNQETYIQSRKDKGVTYEDGIISQYGLGSMKPGGYDRYTPFINHPNAEFLVTGLPMGMVQASCNPYKKERALKGVDLGQIKDEILDKFGDELNNQRVTFGTLKRISEMDTSEKSVGFTYKDMLAIYGNAPSFTVKGGKDLERQLQQMSQTLYKDIPYEDKKLFNRVYVNGYDVIKANSGGHKCITNISGINFLYPKSKFDDPEKRKRVSYVDLLKAIQQEFVDTLKLKIEQQKEPVSENYFRLKKKLVESYRVSDLKKLITEAEKRAWSKGVFDNGDGVNTPKISINKGANFFDVKYEGPETGFNIESAILNPGDSIHQLSNVFTYEVNKHLKDLYQRGVYVQPDMESIEMIKKPKYFEIKVQFNKVDKENAITRMDRRGGMGHPATKGKSLMEEKCNQYSGCKKVYTVKAGSITEHFVSYTRKPKKEGEETDSDLINNLEKVFDKKETFEKQQQPYSYEEGVELVQTALQFLGFSLPEWGVDGKFGPETEKAVIDFQKKNSIEPTGIADQETIAKIIEKVDEENFEDEDMSKIQKSRSKSIVDDDDTIPSNLVIGDSQSPYVANGSTEFKLISSKGSEDSLWLGGKTLSWLLSAVKKHKGSSNVKNIAIVIGTNGNFNTNDDISGLITELESKFPNAKLYVVQGSWGWGGLKNTTEQKVRKYYQKFKDLGVTVIEPPIGDIEPHGNKPVYKKIGASLDGKV
jgi:hypothetical protein